MENSTVHNDQVTGLDAEDLFIQTDQSAAGFNIDQFHLVMPVVVERMEDFAVVCISFYGKLKGAVRASFLRVSSTSIGGVAMENLHFLNMILKMLQKYMYGIMLFI